MKNLNESHEKHFQIKTKDVLIILGLLFVILMASIAIFASERTAEAATRELPKISTLTTSSISAQLATSIQERKRDIDKVVSRANYTRQFTSQGIPMDIVEKYKLRPIGTFKCSFYTTAADECGNSKGIGASGVRVKPGYSVAIDTRYYNFYTKFYVEGFGVMEAHDTGGAIKGPNRMDICVENKSIAKKYGRKTLKVWILE